MTEGLWVGLTDMDELRSLVLGRAHWIVIVGRNVQLIDEIDKALGVFPTFPTIMCPSASGLVWVSPIPKDRVSKRRMIRAVSVATGQPIVPNPDQDMFVLAAPEEFAGIRQFVVSLEQGALPC